MAWPATQWASPRSAPSRYVFGFAGLAKPVHRQPWGKSRSVSPECWDSPPLAAGGCQAVARGVCHAGGRRAQGGAGGEDAGRASSGGDRVSLLASALPAVVAPGLQRSISPKRRPAGRMAWCSHSFMLRQSLPTLAAYRKPCQRCRPALPAGMKTLCRSAACWRGWSRRTCCRAGTRCCQSTCSDGAWIALRWAGKGPDEGSRRGEPACAGCCPLFCPALHLA